MGMLYGRHERLNMNLFRMALEDNNNTTLTKNASLVLKAEANTNCRCGNSCARLNSGLNCIRESREAAIKKLEELGIIY